MTRIKQTIGEVLEWTFSPDNYIPVILTGVAAGLAGRGIDAVVPNSVIPNGEIQKGVVGALPLLYIMYGGLNCVFREDRGILDAVAWGAYALGVSISYADKIYDTIENFL
ncbi:hypothetical protein GF386_01775 [Candidatus Pacearchaeota archaeon]|nr:hypothetical protein [Candidatus Pacearchaeota archaeon]MBD3282909.1 hypothetical protein [Candidatus Pacearchaeota archaeon]